ncbi:MAG: hypothetical protein MK132_21520, partial [Lentisphaerales bacterium]|nr:hypothetical protein [Lentisphaerales bacterium]
MMMDLDELEEHLGYLRACGHEVLLFQILDPFELSLDSEDAALFEDMESGQKMFINPSIVREEYQQKIQAHNQQLATICENLGIHYQLMTTDQPLNAALGEFLRVRDGGKL